MRGKRFALIALSPLPVSAACRFFPAFAGLWSRTVIAAYAEHVSRWTARLAFPLAEVLVLALAAALLTLLAARRFRACLRLLSSLLAILLAGYCLLWYPLYFAPGSRPRASAVPADAAALAALADRLTSALAEGEADPQPLTPAALSQFAAEALSDLPEKPFTFAPPPAKPARYPEWMSMGRLAGLFVPWTAEALFSAQRPTAAQPFTACHELAHLCGIADEGQANIAAYRACVRAGGAAARSARLQALACALPRLRQLDSEAWAARVSRLDPQTQADLQAMGGLSGTTRELSPFLRALAHSLGIRDSLEDYSALADCLAISGIGVE